jgi:hypothetical protein
VTQRGRSRIHLRPRPLDRSDSWCWPGWNSSAHFIIKGWAASSVSPAIDVSYIRHKIRLTLRLSTPTLLVEQGFAGFFGGCDLHLFRSAATHRQPLCTMLFPRSPGFDSPPFVGQTLAETRCLQEPAPCSGCPGASMTAPALKKRPLPRLICRRKKGEAPAQESSAVPVSGMAVLPQRRFRPAINGPAASLPRTANSAVFNNASLNAHIEWRFP